jgi:S1-C subfamily serine protease
MDGRSVEAYMRSTRKNLETGIMGLLLVILAGFISYGGIVLIDLRRDANELQRANAAVNNVASQLTRDLDSARAASLIQAVESQVSLEALASQVNRRTSVLSELLSMAETNSIRTKELQALKEDLAKIGQGQFSMQGRVSNLEAVSTDIQQRVIDSLEEGSIRGESIAHNTEAIARNTVEITDNAEAIAQDSERLGLLLSANFNEVYRNVGFSIFCISVTSGCNATGWLAAEGLIMTVPHGVGISGAKVLVHQATYPPFLATVWRTDNKRGIALLTFDPYRVELDPLAKPIPIKTVETLDSGIPLMSLGYSNSVIKDNGTVGLPSAKVGVLSQVFDYGESGEHLGMDLPIDPGDSGAPVVTVDGAVVGMSRTAIEEISGQRVTGISLAVSSSTILATYPELQ